MNLNNNMTATAASEILIVDDDCEIRSLPCRYLEEQGFRVAAVGGIRDCNDALARRTPDLIVLDVMLPDGSGLDLCRELRNRRTRIPVILVTALKEDIDRIVGVEIGADDYLVKPFNPRELLARIRAVLRRVNDASLRDRGHRAYRFAGLTLDPRLSSVVRDNDQAAVVLTRAEFDLLRAFLERSGRLLAGDQLLDFTQGRVRDPADRSIDVLMSRLRRNWGRRRKFQFFELSATAAISSLFPSPRRGTGNALA